LNQENCKLQRELKMVASFREDWDNTQSLLSMIQGNNKELQLENSEIRDQNYQFMNSRDSYSWLHIILTILLLVGVIGLLYCTWMRSCCLRLSTYVAGCGFTIIGLNIYKLQGIKHTNPPPTSKMNGIVVV